MSWLAAAPVALACAAWLFVPGLLFSYAAGLRGIAAWGTAPACSVAMIGATAVLTGFAGITWSVVPVVVVALVASAVVAFVALLLRRRFSVVAPADGARVLLAAGLGIVPALVLGAITIVDGFGRPDSLSQTFDAVFHYSAVSYILESGKGSPLAVGALGDLTAGSLFYPAAWHEVTSLVALSTGTPVAVAVNLVSAAIAVLCWPVACLLLVRQIVGRSVAAMAVTGVVSLAFVAFPWSLLSFGVLWPNLLGLSLVPAALALILSILRLATDDAIGAVRAWLILPVVLVGTVLSHPNAFFSVAALAIPAIIWAAVPRVRRLYREGQRNRAIAEAAGALLVFGLIWWWVATTPALALVREFYWPPIETPAQAIGEFLLNAPQGRPAMWLLSAVVVAGWVAVWRLPRQRWLLAALALSGTLFVMAASMNQPATRKFTGYWYNDSFRLAAMLPVITVPLTVFGILLLAGLVRTLLARGRTEAEVERPDKPGTRRGILHAVQTHAALAVAITALLILGSRFFYLPLHVTVLRETYESRANHTLVDAAERRFLDRAGELLPPDAVVANNPWDGSTLLWPLTGHKPLFGHLTPTWNDDRRYLASHLADAGSDPRVCQAADRLGVEYMIVGEQDFWPHDPRSREYRGIVDPGQRPGFEVLASDGTLKLFRVAACTR